MIKFFCDICKKEIIKENSLFGNFTYFTRKMDFLSRRPKENAVQVEMLLCEDCTKIMKEHIENLAKDYQKV
jgi:hypothetical protein